MSEPNDGGSAERTEQTESLADQGRREALVRFAKYTPPLMLAVLISASGTAAASPISGPS